MQCPSCGSENESGRKFCLSCGQRLALACPHCGVANTPGARFCGECGNAIDESETPATVAAGPGSEAPATERRLVSVLFADLVGFTTLSEARGRRGRPRSADHLLRHVPRHRGALRRDGREVHRGCRDGGVGHADRPGGRRRASGARRPRAGRRRPPPGRRARDAGAGAARGGSHRRGGRHDRCVRHGDGGGRPRQHGQPAPVGRTAGHGARRRGDATGRRQRDRLRACGRPGSQGQGSSGERLSRAARRRPARRRGAQRRARAALRRPRERAAADQGLLPRHRPRPGATARLGRRPGRHRQEPAGMGVPEVHRWRHRGRVLAPGPLPGVRRGHQLLGARRDGAHADRRR